MRNLIATVIAFLSFAALFAPFSAAQSPPARPLAAVGSDSQSPAERQSEAAIEAALAGVIPEARFVNQPLDQVMEFLRESLHVNMHVRWSDLASAGVPRETPISVNVRNLPAQRVLRLVLDNASDETSLDYEICDGVLQIATREMLDKNLVTRVYPLHDLLESLAPRMVRRPAAAMTETLSPAERLVKTADAQERERLAAASQPAPPDEARLPGGITIMGETFIDLVTNAVEPDSWVTTGAGRGTINLINGALVVRNSRRVHCELECLLRDLRRAAPAPRGDTDAFKGK